MPHLSVTDLVVEYGNGDYVIRPLNGFELEAGPGSLVILLGPSGCGKTTLLSCLGGMLTPTSGSIRFGDLDVGALSRSEMTEYRRHTVGFVFQAFQLVPSLTALENVVLPMRSAGVSRSEARTRAASILERVDMTDRMTHRPGDLSGGQQQRVAIARALALDPQLVLADEPTAHLDFIQVEEVLKLIRSLASEGRTIVVSTHDSRLIPLADILVEMVPNFLNNDRPPEPVTLEAGEVLFRQGDTGDLVYIIERGDIAVFREHADGTRELLVVLSAGNYVGEMGPFFGLPRSATVEARTASMLTGYTPRRFRELVGDGLRSTFEDPHAAPHDA
jgi:putative ABC transport system ATP-binding protein